MTRADENALADPLTHRIGALCRASLGAGTESCRALSGGLGARRFFRVTLDIAPFSLIARCEMPEDPSLRPPGVAPEPPLEPIRRLLETSGLPVPKRYGADERAGIELLEDLGDSTLEDRAARAPVSERRALYAQACALLPRLQSLSANPAQVPNFARHLDAPLFAYKAAQVCDWLIPRTTGKPATEAERTVVVDAFSQIEASALAAPQRLAHRDFKAQNLHVVAGGDDAPKIVMIDLQGAFLAPPEYDLVCLLCDLHVALPDAEVTDLLSAVRPRLPDAPSPDDFERRFTLLTLSRVGKDVSRFLYAIERRGDERYRRFVPNGIRQLLAASARAAGWSPALARFAELLAPLQESSCER